MQRKHTGFTLIEVMIAVVIVGLLAAIAYPSYLSQVEKTRRSEGLSLLVETAQRLERCYALYGRYDSDACPVALPVQSDAGFYEVSAESLAASGFRLKAEPQGVQAKDACKALTLAHTGSRGAGAEVAKCWSR